VRLSKKNNSRSVGLEEVANVVTRKIQVALPDVVQEALVVGDEEWGDK
jgi:hypothetical protein